MAQYSAGWRDYLVTGGRLHYAWWSHRFFEGRTALFPGITAAILAAIALVNRDYWRDPRVRMAVAIGVLGLAFSFGTALPGYAWLHEHMPLLGASAMPRDGAGCRWPPSPCSRDLALRPSRRQARQRWRLVPALLCVLITLEAIRTPVGYHTVRGHPAHLRSDRKRAIRRDCGIPVLLRRHRQSQRPVRVGEHAVLQAAAEWLQQDSSRRRSRHGAWRSMQFPRGRAFDVLRQAKVTHVFVHVQEFAGRYGQDRLNAVDTSPELQLVVEDDGIRLYRLK